MTTQSKMCKRSKAYLILTTGFAVFSMFFGSGNLVFPLMLGRLTGTQFDIATIGLLITGIGVPFLGLLGISLYNGSVEDFFGTLGRRAPFLISTLLLALLGPFGVLPRCITVAHGGMELLNDNLSLPLFSLVFCGISYAIVCNKKKMIDIIGAVLSPVLLGSLILIIIAGIMEPSYQPSPSPLSPTQSFQTGLTEGYQTMDLLAAFFFAAAIIKHMQQKLALTTSCPITLRRFSLLAKTVGASLLAIIYGFMVYLGACYSHLLSTNAPEQSLGIIAQLTLGSLAATTICIAIVMACLTTTVALTSIASDFVHKHFFKEKIDQRWPPLLILTIAFVFSLLQFNGIARILSPILDILYPGLILLTVVNIVGYYFGWRKTVKVTKVS